MDEAAKKERNAYMREWREKNQEKVKAAQKKYWENRAKKASGKSRFNGNGIVPDELHF